MKIKLAGIERNSVVDGPGLRTVLFVQGCPHRCPGCHNPQAQPWEGGYWRDVDSLAESLCAERGIRGVTFSGGEPFAQAEALAYLAGKLKKAGLDIVVYSGYTYEELCEMAKNDGAVAALLENCDLLVDGPYLEEKRDIGLAFRGSSNQRIIDMPATRAQGQVVLSEYNYR